MTSKVKINVFHIFSPYFIGYTVDVLCVAGGFVVNCPRVLVDLNEAYFSSTFAETVEQLAIKAGASFGIQGCTEGNEYEIISQSPKGSKSQITIQ